MQIRQRINPSGTIVWQLDTGEGKGGRKTYRTEALAKAAMKTAQNRRDRHGIMAEDISPAEMAEIVTVRNRLKGMGATLTEVAEFFAAHGKRLQEPLSLVELARRFRLNREQQGLSGVYVKQLRVSLGSLGKMFPQVQAHELTPRDVQAWIKSGTWEPKTRSNYLGDVSAMYEWAMLPTQGHARMNPCVGVQRDPKKRRGTTAALTVAQAEQMLRAALKQKRWRILAYLTLGLFGGLRPEEAAYQGLTWADIHLDERTVRLSEEVVKTGPGRVVDLTEHAVAWLRLIPEVLCTGPMVPSTSWVNEWTVFRYRLGWRVMSDKTRVRRCMPDVEAVHGEWPNDVIRHTFASMHYAHHQNEAALQVQMGHRSAKMLHEHYRAVRTRQEAAAFWALCP